VELSRQLVEVQLEAPNGKCFVYAGGGLHQSALFLLFFYCVCTCSWCIVPQILTLLHGYAKLLLIFSPFCVATCTAPQFTTFLHCYVMLFLRS